MDVKLTPVSTASLVARGILALLFGVMVLIWPGITLHVIVILFALYTLIGGTVAAVGAVVDRHENSAWPLSVIFGSISALIGLYLLGRPSVTALVMVFLVALYAMVAGITDLVAGITLRKQIKGEWVLIVVGILSILVSLYLFANPGSGIVAILWFVAIYSLLSGIMWLVAAFSHDTARRRA